MRTRTERWATAIGTVKLVRLVGFTKADELIGFVADWKAFIVAHDRPPHGFEEYCAWTRKFSTRTAYSRLALLRATFPEAGPQATPTDFVGPMLDEIERELGQS